MAAMVGHPRSVHCPRRRPLRGRVRIHHTAGADARSALLAAQFTAQLGVRPADVPLAGARQMQLLRHVWMGKDRLGLAGARWRKRPGAGSARGHPAARQR